MPLHLAAQSTTSTDAVAATSCVSALLLQSSANPWYPCNYASTIIFYHYFYHHIACWCWVHFCLSRYLHGDGCSFDEIVLAEMKNSSGCNHNLGRTPQWKPILEISFFVANPIFFLLINDSTLYPFWISIVAYFKPRILNSFFFLSLFCLLFPYFFPLSFALFIHVFPFILTYIFTLTLMLVLTLTFSFLFSFSIFFPFSLFFFLFSFWTKWIGMFQRKETQ